MYGAQRDERRALVERAGSERLDGLVVGGGHDRQALRDAGRRRRVGSHVAGDVAGHLQLHQQLRAHVERLEQRGIPLPRVGVDRPLQDDVVGGAVAELAGEAMRDVAGRGGGVGELGVVGDPGLVGARVHPAHDGLEQRAVRLEEGLAAADGAQADAEDVRRVAGELRHHLAAGRDDGLPQVVVGVHGVARLGVLHREERALCLADDVAREVVDDHLGALGAVVDADQVLARHQVAPVSARPSGRGSRRRPRARGR